MHRILLRTVVLDFPADVHDAARDFWQQTLDAGIRRGKHHPEYHVLERSAVLGRVLIQSLGTGPARIHLDIETDDIEAEVARLLAAGAVEVDRHDDWIVMRDPAGLLFCVVPPVDDDFATAAHTVEP